MPPRNVVSCKNEVRAVPAIFFFYFEYEGVFFSLSPQARENTFSEENAVDFNNSALPRESRAIRRCAGSCGGASSRSRSRLRTIHLRGVTRSRSTRPRSIANAERGCPTRQPACETKVVINDRVVGAGAPGNKRELLAALTHPKLIILDDPDEAPLCRRRITRPGHVR